MIDRPLTGRPFAARRVGFRFVHIGCASFDITRPLLVPESESTALIDYVRRYTEDDLFTAALARTELARAVAVGARGR
jgi:hypothetical protein